MKINLKLRKIEITIVERHQLGEGCTILFFCRSTSREAASLPHRQPDPERAEGHLRPRVQRGPGAALPHGGRCSKVGLVIVLKIEHFKLVKKRDKFIGI